MKKTYETVSVTEAENRGYLAITTAYSPGEEKMLDNVIRDMRGCNFLLVQLADGIAVYRKKVELKTC